MPLCASRAHTHETRKIASATATVGAQVSACSRNWSRISGSRGKRDGGREARAADAADERQLDAGAADPEVEAEDVELEALDAAHREAEHAAKRDLHAAAARRAREDLRAGEVLADRGRWQVDAELRHGAPDPGGEGVRVRPRPERVFLGVRVVLGRLVDAADELVDASAALVGIELGLGADPGRVGLSMADGNDAIVPAQAPADHLVDGVLLRVARLYRYPGMYPEDPLWPGGAGAVDLHHRLAHERRIRREALGGMGKAGKGKQHDQDPHGHSRKTPMTGEAFPA